MGVDVDTRRRHRSCLDSSACSTRFGHDDLGTEATLLRPQASEQPLESPEQFGAGPKQHGVRNGDDEQRCAVDPPEDECSDQDHGTAR
jgi:hypothetical protein